MEVYLLGRLPGQQKGDENDPEVCAIEEHLLWCEKCQIKAEIQDREIAALRNALAGHPRSAQVSRKALGLAIDVCSVTPGSAG